LASEWSPDNPAILIDNDLDLVALAWFKLRSVLDHAADVELRAVLLNFRDCDDAAKSRQANGARRIGMTSQHATGHQARSFHQVNRAFNDECGIAGKRRLR